MHDYEKGLWLLNFYYYCAHTYNNDYLSQLWETIADCFIGFCLQLSIHFHFISVHYFLNLLRVLYSTLCDLYTLVVVLFAPNSVNNHFFITLGHSCSPEANLAHILQLFVIISLKTEDKLRFGEGSFLRWANSLCITKFNCCFWSQWWALHAGMNMRL